MNLNIVLIFMMLIALFLSLVSVVMVVVCLLKTNTKMKSFFKFFRFCYLNNFIEKGLKRNDSQFKDPELLYQDFTSKRPVRTAEKLTLRN